jgi:hypothetical protein
MKIPEIKTKQIIDFLKRLPRALGARAFLTFLAFLFVTLILGGVIFYQYSILPQKETPEVSGKTFKFEEAIYRGVLNTWEEKERDFQEAGSKDYLDPFQEIEGEVPENGTPPEEPEEPEEPTPEPTNRIEELLASRSLYEFYLIKEGYLPSISERAEIWQEKGLGPTDSYYGFFYQNVLLLDTLKNELTE